MTHTGGPPNLELKRLRESPRARRAAGRSRRERVPLEAHAELTGETGRPDPLGILAQQDTNRVQRLVPIRYGRMSRNPFTFLRGAAAVMASDLAAGPTPDLHVMLCGDAHLSNFGWFASPERRLVFDINDFDETFPGPFEWDVKRLAASAMVCARNNGISREKCRAATRAAVQTYREFIAMASGLSPLELYYYHIEAEGALKRIQALSKKSGKRLKKVLGKASRKNSLRAFNKLTVIEDGRRIIVSDPPLVERLADQETRIELEEVSEFFAQYRETLPLDRRLLIDQFSLVDIARKVVGVGSVGTNCWIVLLESGDGTPLFLQLKQAVSSVLEPYVSVLEPYVKASGFDHAGQRAVEGQRMIQAASDVLLGWARWYGDDGHTNDYYVRQLWDGKGSSNVEVMGRKRLKIYAGVCGEALALAHARTGDAAMIHGYIGDDTAFDDAIVEFADRYADRTEADYSRLSAAIDDGEIVAIKDI